jgi:hypothetical protein
MDRFETARKPGWAAFWLLASLSIVLVLGVASPATADEWQAPAVTHDTSPPLTSIPAKRQGNGHAFPARRKSGTNADIALTPKDRAHLQTQLGPGTAPSTATNWEGVNNVNGVLPPDTNGDVGPNDYVQWVNLSFQIWNKNTGAKFYSTPAGGNTLWSGFGTGTPASVCASTNQGDPIVLYDRLANRWFFSQFAFNVDRRGNPVAPYYQCIAVSTTGDPRGSYYRYGFEVNAPAHPGYFPDYPKFGVWPDAYYMTANNFNGNTFAGAAAYAFDRAKMLNGQAATFKAFQLSSQYEGLLPSNYTGTQQPPAGSPNYFGAVDTSSTAGTGSTFQIWKFHADFATPANATFTGPTNVPVNTYKYSFCGQTYSSSCIPQPGTTRKLDPLADRLMNRLQYRNFGDHETLIASHTVNAGTTSDQAGVRWYELRAPGSATPTVQQQDTFAPADGVNRWMGSAAMDGSGNMALGYSASNGSSVFPSVRYTGRLAGDPPNQMTQGEGSIVAGAGSENGSYSRWGDYSSMSVDPNDDSTFWYTQEYYQASSAAGWQTRIGSFKLSSTAYRDAVLGTSGLQGYWRFGESSGATAVDEKGASSGSYAGGFVLGQPGALAGDSNTSVSFDGSTGFASVPLNPAYGQGTIEFWGYATDLSSRNGVVYTADNGAGTYSHQVGVLGDGRVRLYIYDGNLRFFDTAPGLVHANEWHQYALVWTDGGTADLYVDGVNRGGVPIGTSWKGGNKVLFGQASGGASGLTNAWQGRLDEPAVYNAALSAATIQQHYNTGHGP